ncbi:MinD/ParA family protein [Alkalilimnicola sp. S0819]|uniref:MinD/ParA family protein n=1 Tax=Alkalilimnicola sp. S0819 TaxID=2613922 RepID=UPI001261B94C|nr:MinD/ParA family protein [Alkalilimnicola sp. S0819]KAB7627165.1 MinD/ParA family protein [Alkalilimnicola sp. S0819]MPQ15875.1 P-loop NTPase [Alkalilimnicola sp. S0819]
MANPKPVKVIAVTSGKGGVGKTNVSVNLAVSLSRLGRKVMLFDADLGLANVDVQLGLSAKHNLSHVIDGSATLEEVLLQGPEGIWIVPASSGTQRMAELDPAEHVGLIRSFSELNHDLDYLIVDTAAGISDGVVSFARAARDVMVVVCDEPSSITDAYALCKVLSKDHGVERFHVVANRVRSPAEGQALHAKLAAATNRFLDLTLDYAGAVPEDDALRRAVQRQKAVSATFPGSPAGRAFVELARRVDKWPLPTAAEGHLEFFVERLIQYSADMGEVV